MQNQSVALAESCGLQFTFIELKPKILPRIFPYLLAGRLNLTLSDKDNLILNLKPDIVFTCGRRMASLSIGLKRLFAKNKKKIITVHIQNPKLNLKLFDFLVVPEHDNLIGENVITTLGSLNQISKTSVDISFNNFNKKLKATCKNHIAVLVGGHTKNQKLNFQSSKSFIDELNRISKLLELSVVITCSRRTPKNLFNQLKVFKVLETEKNFNPYPGILKNAKLIIVTSDSVNMISEALSFGCPVILFDLLKPRGRKRKFVENLIKNKYLTYSTNILNKNQLNEMRYKPLNEASKVGQILQEKFKFKIHQ